MPQSLHDFDFSLQTLLLLRVIHLELVIDLCCDDIARGNVLASDHDGVCTFPDLLVELIVRDERAFFSGVDRLFKRNIF